jgi:hypothetical protein
MVRSASAIEVQPHPETHGLHSRRSVCAPQTPIDLVNSTSSLVRGESKKGAAGDYKVDRPAGKEVLTARSAPRHKTAWHEPTT